MNSAPDVWIGAYITVILERFWNCLWLMNSQEWWYKLPRSSGPLPPFFCRFVENFYRLKEDFPQELLSQWKQIEELKNIFPSQNSQRKYFNNSISICLSLQGVWCTAWVHNVGPSYKNLPPAWWPGKPPISPRIHLKDRLTRCYLHALRISQPFKVMNEMPLCCSGYGNQSATRIRYYS